MNPLLLLFFQLAAVASRPDSVSASDRIAKALASADWEERFYGVRDLGAGSAVDGRPYVPKLRALLKSDPSYQVRDEAIWALRRVQGDGAVLVASVVGSLTGESEVVRRSAVMVIGDAASAASSATPGLVLRLRDVDVSVRAEAARALRKIKDSHGLDALAAELKIWAAGLEAADANERGRAAFLLGSAGPLAAEYASALTRLLVESEGYPRSSAREALTEIGGRKRAGRTGIVGFLDGTELGTLRRVCECELYRGNVVEPRNRMFETREERTKGLVKIDGEPVLLSLGVRSGGRHCRRGSRFTERWQGGTISIRLDLRAVRTGEEACWYEGTMSVGTSGAKPAGATRETVRVYGSCGC